MAYDARILLVDDEEFYLELHADLLADRNLFIRTARNGAEALERLRSESFDILISDFVMPGMDGLELTERARAEFPWIDVIVITQRDDVRLAVRSMRMGVFEYLVKPIDREELLLALDRLLERRRLQEQKNKLLDESIQNLQAQAVYRRCLEILSTLDLEVLCEVILRHLLQAVGAQGGLLWLTSPEERGANKDALRLNLTAFRGLVRLEDFPTTIPLREGSLLEAIKAETPFFEDPSAVFPGEERPALSEALFIPLTDDQEPVGLLVLLDKLQADFTERDQHIARTMAQFSAIALKNARRFLALERLGLRDQNSTAYNLTYFIDYAGKEIYKARRYGRSFSLVAVVIDRYDFLRQHFKSEVWQRLSRRLPESVARVVRDSDIVARVSDSEYFVLLPETDALGARTFIRRSLGAFFADAFIVELCRDYPISISFGAASFPLEGADFDQLLAVCRDELEASRQSLVRRLRLEERRLWDAVRLLIGHPSEHRLPLTLASEAFQTSEDLVRGSAHGRFSDAEVDAIEEEVCRQAIDAPGRRAIAYALTGSIGAELQPIERVLSHAEGVRAFLIVPRAGAPEPSAEGSHVTRVYTDDEAVSEHRLFLVLGERLCYAFLGERGKDGELHGLHTSDLHLVECLVAKLQEHFHFQPSY